MPVFPSRGDNPNPATMHVPDEDEPDAVHLLGSLAPAPAALRERWLAYHRDLPTPGVARFEVESIKAEGEVLDRSEFTLSNPLRSIESALCRLANSDPRRLACLCESITRVSPTSPVAVGVDAWGLDVRARVGVMRVEFDRTLDPAHALAWLTERLAQS